MTTYVLDLARDPANRTKLKVSQAPLLIGTEDALRRPITICDDHSIPPVRHIYSSE